MTAVRNSERVMKAGREVLTRAALDIQPHVKHTRMVNEPSKEALKECCCARESFVKDCKPAAQYEGQWHPDCVAHGTEAGPRITHYGGHL